MDWPHMAVRIRAPIGWIRCEPGWRMAPYWSQRLGNLDLWSVWAGRGEMVLRQGRRIALRPGTTLWMRPGGQYLAEQNPDDPLSISFIHFDLVDRSGQCLVSDAQLPPELHEMDDAGSMDVMYRTVELLTRYPGRDAGPIVPGGEREIPDHLVLAATHLLTSVLIELDAASDQANLDARASGRTAHHRRVVLTAAARLRESAAEAPSVAELAAQAGYSHDHFTRLFHQFLGRTPLDFIIQTRLDRARQLLIESSLGVAQIADVLGYPDVYSFSRQFKKHVGHSPKQYREAR